MMNEETSFIGREKELNELKLLHNRKLATLVVIKGRRRIGKSRLIEEFARGKKFLRFEGIAPTRKTTAKMQREEFARQIHRQLGLETACVNLYKSDIIWSNEQIFKDRRGRKNFRC